MKNINKMTIEKLDTYMEVLHSKVRKNIERMTELQGDTFSFENERIVFYIERKNKNLDMDLLICESKQRQNYIINFNR